MKRAGRLVCMTMAAFMLLTGYQAMVYQDLIYVMEWASDTLHINVKANRELLRSCKRFGWCEER